MNTEGLWSGATPITNGAGRVTYFRNHYVSDPVMVTRTKTGEAAHWALIDIVKDRREESSPFTDAEKVKEAADRGYEYHIGEGDQCEWPVQTDFRYGQCSRTAAKNAYGLSLCWQHEDAAFSHVLHQLRAGAYRPIEVEQFTNALLNAEQELGGWDGHFGHINTSPLIYHQVKAYLERLAEGHYIEPGVSQALDRVIQKRLEETWGASA